MLATGGTLNDSLDYVFDRGALSAACICLLATPEGVETASEHVISNWPDEAVSIHLGSLDERLNEFGFIFPGLGDAGDRLFGAEF